MSGTVTGQVKFKQTETPPAAGIPEGWELVTLRNVARVNELTISKEYPFDEIEYIDISSVDKGSLLGIQKLFRKEAPSRAQRIVKDNDILLSTVRPNLKHFAYIERMKPNLIASTGFAVISAKKINPRYLYYYLTTDSYTNFLSAIADTHTSAYPAYNPDVLENSQIPVPSDSSEQRAIAKILSGLDDKIELNRRMNETLEHIARAIFKRWFVDFEFPGHEKVKFVNGLPEGWRLGTLGKIADNPRRGIDPERIVMSTPYIGLEHMPRRCISLSDWGCADDLESNKFAFKRGEILFGKLRPYFHKVAVAPIDGVCSTDILVVVPKEPEWFGFVLAQIIHDDFINYATATSTGTKMPRTSWQNMARYEITLPTKELAADFTARVQPLIDKIITNIYESRILSNTRDTLLPKLMSGEIRA